MTIKMMNAMKNLTRLATVLLLTVVMNTESQAQEPTWAWQVDAENSLCLTRLLKTDVFGNTYVIGSYSEFDLTIQDQVLPLPEGESSANFMLKIDPNGNLLWMKSFPGTLVPTDIAITSDGRLFFAFTITPETPLSLIDIDGISFTMYLGINGYVYEFDEDGTAIAGHEFQDGSNFFTLSGLSVMEVDNDDNLILSGAFSNSLNINGFELSNTLTEVLTAGFLLKMDTDGVVAWGEEFIPTSQGGGLVFMDVASDNAIVGFGGWGGDTLYIGDDVILENTEEGDFVFDDFSVKFSADGDLIWATHFESNDEITGGITGIAATSDNGATLFFNGGEYVVNDVPLNQTGGYLAKQNFEGGLASVENITSEGFGSRITLTDDDGFLITSQFDTETFTIPGTNITSAGLIDAVVFKLNSDLETEWFVQIGAEDQDFVLGAQPVDGGYIVGGDYASAELDFGGTTITNDFTPDTDLFIAKLDVPLSVTNRDGVELINVYPNPTSDFIQIDLSGADAGIDQISIFDMTGKMVLQENNTAGQFIQIEVSELPQGQYTMLLRSGMVTYVSKFIKQ
jgi:hypothetical protein